jgi:hypothetical protein
MGEIVSEPSILGMRIDSHRDVFYGVLANRSHWLISLMMTMPELWLLLGPHQMPPQMYHRWLQKVTLRALYAIAAQDTY